MTMIERTHFFPLSSHRLPLLGEIPHLQPFVDMSGLLFSRTALLRDYFSGNSEEGLLTPPFLVLLCPSPPPFLSSFRLPSSIPPFRRPIPFDDSL